MTMPDHAFEGDGPYCEHWNVHFGNTITFRSVCGWPRSTHPSGGTSPTGTTSSTDQEGTT